jgi:hypothetical protein
VPAVQAPTPAARSRARRSPATAGERRPRDREARREQRPASRLVSSGSRCVSCRVVASQRGSVRQLRSPCMARSRPSLTLAVGTHRQGTSAPGSAAAAAGRTRPACRAGRALDAQPAAVQFDDPPRDRQPESAVAAARLAPPTRSARS